MKNGGQVQERQDFKGFSTSIISFLGAKGLVLRRFV